MQECPVLEKREPVRHSADGSRIVFYRLPNFFVVWDLCKLFQLESLGTDDLTWTWTKFDLSKFINNNKPRQIEFRPEGSLVIRRDIYYNVIFRVMRVRVVCTYQYLLTCCGQKVNVGIVGYEKRNSLD